MDVCVFSNQARYDGASVVRRVDEDTFHFARVFGLQCFKSEQVVAESELVVIDDIVANFMLVFSAGMFSDSAELEKRNRSDEVNTMVARLEKVTVKLERMVD